MGEFRADRLSEEELNPAAKGGYFKGLMGSVYVGERVTLQWGAYKETAPSWFVIYMEENILSVAE